MANTKLLYIPALGLDETNLPAGPTRTYIEGADEQDMFDLSIISLFEALTTSLRAGGNVSDLVNDAGYLDDAGVFATSAQGTLADTATQPGDNVSSLVNDAGYLDNAGLFATAAQGLLADSASQAGDNISDFVNDAGYVTSAGGAIETEVFRSLAVDGTDIHVADKTHADIPWVDAADGVWFSVSGATFTALQDIPKLVFDMELGITDSGVNNRSVYVLNLLHTDSVDTPIWQYNANGIYLRDDAATHDSGAAQRTGEIRNILTGDKITVRSFVKDTQTASGSVCPLDGNDTKLIMTVIE